MAKLCQKCGASLQDDAKFCGSCGTACAEPAPAAEPAKAASNPYTQPAGEYKPEGPAARPAENTTSNTQSTGASKPQPQGSAPYGQPQGGAPYGQPQGGAPYGQPQGRAPYGQPQGGAPHGQPQGGAPYGQQPPYAQGGYPAPQKKTNIFAILALIFGIVGILFFQFIFGPLGVVFGIIAMNQIERDPARQTGRGLALAGFICGIVGIALFVFLLIIGSAIVSSLLSLLTAAL